MSHKKSNGLLIKKSFRTIKSVRKKLTKKLVKKWPTSSIGKWLGKKIIIRFFIQRMIFSQQNILGELQHGEIRRKLS